MLRFGLVSSSCWMEWRSLYLHPFSDISMGTSMELTLLQVMNGEKAKTLPVKIENERCVCCRNCLRCYKKDYLTVAIRNEGLQEWRWWRAERVDSASFCGESPPCPQDCHTWYGDSTIFRTEPDKVGSGFFNSILVIWLHLVVYTRHRQWLRPHP